MANWVLTQQFELSLCVLVLLLLTHKASAHLKPSTLYALWCLPLLVVITNNLPQDILPRGASDIALYVVGVKTQSVLIAKQVSWHIVWFWGAVSVLLLAAYGQLSVLLQPTQAVNKQALAAELPKGLAVRQSDYFASPVLSGVFRPTLILPLNFTQIFNPEQQRMVLQHEIVHYRRLDNLANVLALVTLAVCWFNPLVWLAYRAFRQQQELACDAAVLASSSLADKISYSKALLQCVHTSHKPFTLYSQYTEKHTMLRRIESIQQRTANNSITGKLTLLLVGAVFAGLVYANQSAESLPKLAVNEAKPIVRVEPKYPVKAAQDNIEGSVVLQFDIEKDGSTSNIRVIKAIPEATFDRTSIAALQQWKYKPQIVGGQAQVQQNLLVQLDYRLSEDSTMNVSLLEGIKVVAR
jgi:bla regulator protein blaR1